MAAQSWRALEMGRNTPNPEHPEPEPGTEQGLQKNPEPERNTEQTFSKNPEPELGCPEHPESGTGTGTNEKSLKNWFFAWLCSPTAKNSVFFE